MQASIVRGALKEFVEMVQTISFFVCTKQSELVEEYYDEQFEGEAHYWVYFPVVMFIYFVNLLVATENVVI